MHKNSVFRVNTGGNFCGHYPEAPRLFPVRMQERGRGGIPGVLSALYDRLEQYYHRPSTIPSLNWANGSRKQMSSARREACISLLRVIVEVTDLSSLRVGQPTSEGFINYTVSYLADRAGVSLHRARRAFRDLRRSGLISVSQARRLNDQGEYRGLPAVKQVNPLLFAIFGLGQRLRYERKKASQRLKKKAAKWKRSLGDVARFKLFAGGQLEEPTPSQHAQRKRHPLPERAQVPLERRRQIMLLAARLQQENPTWTAKECNEEAQRLSLKELLA